jgi:hypothetical protein
MFRAPWPDEIGAVRRFALFDFDSEVPLESLFALCVLLIIMWALLSVFGLPKWLLSEDRTRRR